MSIATLHPGSELCETNDMKFTSEASLSTLMHKPEPQHKGLDASVAFTYTDVMISTEIAHAADLLFELFKNIDDEAKCAQIMAEIDANTRKLKGADNRSSGGTMGRWIYDKEKLTFDEATGRVTLVDAVRIAKDGTSNLDSPIEDEFKVGGKNKPRDIDLTLTVLTDRERERISRLRAELREAGHPIPDDIEYRILERDDSAINNRIYGLAFTKDGSRIASIRRDILYKDTDDQIMEALDHEAGELSGREHVEIRSKQYKGDLGSLIRRLSDRDKKVKETRNMSWWLDQIEYEGDREWRETLDDSDRAQGVLNELFPEKIFLIQNNSNASNRGMTCSRNCWNCYINKPPLARRQKRMAPMSNEDAAAIVDEVIQMGFERIHINGQDTLDDEESLFSIADACKDRPIAFVFFTHGFRLLEDPKKATEVFSKLKERLGNVKEIRVILSWDPAKVDEYKSMAPFNGDEEAVYHAMGRVLDDFRKVFLDVNSVSDTGRHLIIRAHDGGIDDMIEKDRRMGRFRECIQKNAVTTMYSLEEHSLELSNSPAVIEGAKRGRVTRQFTLEELLEKMAQNLMLTEKTKVCYYNPFLDMATGEITTCINRHEYPRRIVTPENIRDILLKPFSNPRSRHLYHGDKRPIALVKQIGFVLSLRPDLRNKKEASFHQVESYLFSHEDLMMKIESLYLLEDLLYAHVEGFLDDFVYSHIPEELLPFLLSNELLTALLTYYSRYSDRLHYKPAMCAYSLASEFKTSPNSAISHLREILTNRITPKLTNRGVIQPGGAGTIPEGYSRAVDSESACLPNLIEMGLDPKTYLPQCLSSLDPKKRRIGLNIIARLIKDGYDLNNMADTLMANLTPQRLTEDEQVLAVELLVEWLATAHNNQYNNSITYILIEDFIFKNSVNPQCRVLHTLISLEILLSYELFNRRWLGMLYQSRSRFLQILDVAPKMVLYRRWVNELFLTLDAALEAIEQMDLTKETGSSILEEIDSWEKAYPSSSFLFERYKTDRGNKSCGTICEEGHQERLDPQLRQYYRLLGNKADV